MGAEGGAQSLHFVSLLCRSRGVTEDDRQAPFLSKMLFPINISICLCLGREPHCHKIKVTTSYIYKANHN